MLSDITYQMSNVKPTTNGGPYSVKVSMTGYVAFNVDSQEYARITFTSPETIRNVTVYTSSGGGGSRNRTIKFNTDGGSIIPNQTITQEAASLLLLIRQRKATYLAVGIQMQNLQSLLILTAKFLKI